VELFSLNPSTPPSLLHAKEALVRYHSLLHHTSIREGFLSSLYPVPQSPATPPLSISHAFLSSFFQLIKTFLHLRFLLFLPPFIIHTPAYILGLLGSCLFASPDEEEAQAQFKSIFGGVGMGLGYATSTAFLVSWLRRVSFGRWDVEKGDVLGALTRLGQVTAGEAGKVKMALAIAGLLYGTAYVLFRWHNSLVNGRNCLPASGISCSV
jgi:glycerol-3-phosphate O-acyltransferase / dihydroxyacetone phosphate acyltransferase